jgi:hypothetical protein
MSTQNSEPSNSSKSAKGGSRHKALKTAAVLAVIGAASVAVAKGLKTRRGRALEKQAMTKGRKLVRKAKRAARASGRSGRRRTSSRAG